MGGEFMAQHSECRILPYTSQNLMYAVVAETWKNIQNFCLGASASGACCRANASTSASILLAEMLVGFRALRERYTSRVVLDAAARAVDVTQTDGPFRQLDSHWRFTQQKRGLPHRIGLSPSSSKTACLRPSPAKPSSTQS